MCYGLGASRATVWAWSRDLKTRKKERKETCVHNKEKKEKDTSAMSVSRHYPPSKIHCPQWSARCLDTGPSPIPSLYLLVYGFQASAMEGS